MAANTPRIFVSSTWLDLQPERKAVETAIHRLSETKFVGMEYFGSRDETTREASLRQVDDSQVYVGIIGGRYGSGITRDEYHRARERNLPCLFYVKRADAIPPEGRDAEPEKARELAAFLAEARGAHIVSEFSDANDLAARVTADLHNWLVREFLTPRLTELSSGRGSAEEGREFLARLRDERGLDARLLASARSIVSASGAGSVAIGGDVRGGVIVTGDGARINIVAERGGDGAPGCMGAIDGPEDTHARFAMKVPTTVLLAALAVAALALYLFFGRGGGTPRNDGVYRVRVTVLNEESVPIEDARVWSSMGGEPKQVAGGWQFDIPAAARPASGALTIFAAKESAFLTGRTDLTLDKELNPTAAIRLARDVSARIRGQVVDPQGRAVAGARVFVQGYEAESVLTGDGGGFDLPAHAAKTQEVRLYAEKAGLGVADLYQRAGDDPARLVLLRRTP